MNEPQLAVPDSSTLAGLRTALQRTGYSDKAVADALGPRPPFARTRRQVYRRRLLEAGPLAEVVRLFRLGEPVDDEEAAAALAPADG